MTLRAAALSAFIMAACASPGMPPGGPVDNEAPQIVKIVPDSGKTGTSPPAVVFRFNEVVSERPAGAASLQALFIISPRDGEPRVDWSREEIAVKPRRNWKKNTAYTITLLPGLSDLRGNARTEGLVTIFSTGSSIPTGRITGKLFNWAEARVINRSGFVQAWPRGDTTTMYMAPVDSSGTYAMPNLPSGEYVVRGLADDNNNRGLDRREPWDTVSIALTDTARLNLYAFIHDSLGTRLVSAALRDSVTIDLSFESPLSIAQPLTPADVIVRAPDSTQIGVLSVQPPPADTTAAVRALGRPVPPRTMIIKLSRPVRPKTVYRIRVTRITSLSGITRAGDVLLNTPETLPQPAQPRPAAPVSPPAPPPPAPIRR